MALPPRRIPPLGPPPQSPRERILAQWRGVDLSPYEKILTRPAKSSESLVKGVLAGLRIEQRQSETEILAVWQRLIAPDVAAHAQPSGLRNGTLFVSVDSSVWLDEIVRYRRKEILDRLQHSFGRKLIQKISYRVG